MRHPGSSADRLHTPYSSAEPCQPASFESSPGAFAVHHQMSNRIKAKSLKVTENLQLLQCQLFCQFASRAECQRTGKKNLNRVSNTDSFDSHRI